MSTSSAAAQIVTDGLYGDYEIARIRKSPDNRKRFNEQALQELAASITSMGVAQPILIRPVTPTDNEPEDFEIVAGERRYRASIIAGMTPRRSASWRTCSARTRTQSRRQRATSS
jgi:hypothetical protein